MTKLLIFWKVKNIRRRVDEVNIGYLINGVWIVVGKWKILDILKIQSFDFSADFWNKIA